MARFRRGRARIGRVRRALSSCASMATCVWLGEVDVLRMKMVMYLARWLVALTFIALVAAVHERAAAQESPENDRIEDEAPAQEQESSDEPAKSQELQEPLEGPEGMEGSEPVAPPDGTLPPEPELPPLPESAEGVRAADYGAQAPEPSSDLKPAPQQTADTREKVEEIVVTADRRTSNLQSTRARSAPCPSDPWTRRASTRSATSPRPHRMFS